MEKESFLSRSSDSQTPSLRAVPHVGSDTVTDLVMTGGSGGGRGKGGKEEEERKRRKGKRRPEEMEGAGERERMNQCFLLMQEAIFSWKDRVGVWAEQERRVLSQA